MYDLPPHDEPTISQATAYSFSMGSMGWAIFTLNESTGELSIQSDWGDACYRWNINHIGRPTLAEFIMSADVHYLSGKMFIDRPNDREEFSSEKTLKALRQHIIEMRREGAICKDDARELWRESEYWLDSADSTEALWHTIPDPISRLIDDPSYFFQIVDSGRVLRMRQLLAVFKGNLCKQRDRKAILVRDQHSIAGEADG